MSTTPNDKEMEDTLWSARESGDTGSKFPGMTYEQGVAAALEWALGETNTNPMED